MDDKEKQDGTDNAPLVGIHRRPDNILPARRILILLFPIDRGPYRLFCLTSNTSLPDNPPALPALRVMALLGCSSRRSRNLRSMRLVRPSISPVHDHRGVRPTMLRPRLHPMAGLSAPAGAYRQGRPGMVGLCR